MSACRSLFCSFPVSLTFFFIVSVSLLLPGLRHRWLTAQRVTESCSATSYLNCREAGRKSVTAHYTHGPTSAPWAYANAHMQTLIIPSQWQILLAFLTEKKLLMPKCSSRPLEPSTLMISSVFVLVGPWRPLCHLPLPWRQQLLRPHHPGLCDDVTARGCGGRRLLWAAPKVSTPSSHSAHHACMVPRAAAGLGRRGPLLGLSMMNHEVLRAQYANSQGAQRVRSV